MAVQDLDPKLADLRQQMAAVIADLHATGTEDGEAMFFLGGSVAGLCDRGNAKNWQAFKAGLPQPDYYRLLTQLESEGSQLLAEGKQKPAYALQALGLSLVASRQDDDVITAGEGLLDAVINAAVANFRSNTPKTN